MCSRLNTRIRTVVSDRSSRDDSVKNADGFVGPYFDPPPPIGKPESNWIKTLRGKGGSTYFHLHAPTQTSFDRTWALPRIEPLTRAGCSSPTHGLLNCRRLIDWRLESILAVYRIAKSADPRAKSLRPLKLEDEG
jgi:hypothetical protein